MMMMMMMTMMMIHHRPFLDHSFESDFYCGFVVFVVDGQELWMNEEMKANRGDTIHHSRPLQIFQPTVFIVVQKGHFLSSLLMTFLTFVLPYPIKLRDRIG